MPEKGLQVVSGNLEKIKKMIKETEQALQGNHKAIEASFWQESAVETRQKV
jgi:hypothetical protein